MSHVENKPQRYIKYTLIILGVILLVLCIFFVVQYRAVRRSEVMSSRELWFSLILKNHGALTVNDVNVIRPWMTFDYINRLFRLPADYLKARLNISDVHYPQVSLSGYARHNHLDSATFLVTVDHAVRDYLAAQPPAPQPNQT